LKFPEITIEIYFPKSRRKLQCVVRKNDTLRLSAKFWEQKIFQGKFNELVKILKNIGKRNKQDEIYSNDSLLSKLNTHNVVAKTGKSTFSRSPNLGTARKDLNKSSFLPLKSMHQTNTSLKTIAENRFLKPETSSTN
jgi:hypothetical protein